MQRLAKIVAGGGQKLRLGEVGFFRSGACGIGIGIGIGICIGLGLLDLEHRQQPPVLKPDREALGEGPVLYLGEQEEDAGVADRGEAQHIVSALPDAQHLIVGGALGFRRGLLAVMLYVLLGVIGLPFFAEGKGGLIVISGATGGYLIGFVVAGAVVGRLSELGWDRHIGGALGAMLIGSVLIYLVGLPWLMVVTGSSLAETIDKGLRPYLVGDALKLALAAVIFPSAWWFVGRRPDDR